MLGWKTPPAVYEREKNRDRIRDSSVKQVRECEKQRESTTEGVKIDTLSHFFVQFSFSVQLPLYFQCTILCVVNLLLEALDFLLYRIHDLGLVCSLQKTQRSRKKTSSSLNVP